MLRTQAGITGSDWVIKLAQHLKNLTFLSYTCYGGILLFCTDNVNKTKDHKEMRYNFFPKYSDV